ncbi:hypothetical protein BDV95DRAFT_610522 [Massariosphaeria phaeospora]|uniref:Uncharacterized protein n=1 Tax=Massariosphaeria phaeospora TaxID=100035 RepID=A0A7C8MI07_9PLEO|nr:hypothetical protein BDV95DRAFT_610522 [Massariosphaeria phaeospora]
MPSPFHQKYSSQNHKWQGDNTVPVMADEPKQQSQRRPSDTSVDSDSQLSPTERRRSSVGNRFANLHALKRPTDEDSTNRRASWQDSYAKPGILGTFWNNYTRGPSINQQKEPIKETRNTSTLSR